MRDKHLVGVSFLNMICGLKIIHVYFAHLLQVLIVQDNREVSELRH